MKWCTAARALCAATASALVLACVLADPPATLPVVAESAPSILTSVVPPTGRLLSWPASQAFVVPVLVLDPTRTLVWKAFIDFNPILSPPPSPVRAGNNLAANEEGIATLNAHIGVPLGPGCHTLTIVVAYAFSIDNPDEPDAQGGAVAQWSYEPNGQCNGFDAGSLGDASFPRMGDGGTSPDSGGT